MQDVERLHRRLAEIGRSLQARPDALALLGVGSCGVENARMDEHSDLDFFVFVRDGAKPAFIDAVDWLAAAHPIAWHFQNTGDGRKALFADGVYCEFAIFELQEMPHIAYTPGRFIWRRDEVDASLALPTRELPTRASDQWLVGEALSNLLVGLMRHARGEHLAAMRLIQVFALDRVLELAERSASDEIDVRAVRDPYAVDRRVEFRVPAVGALLAQCARGYEHNVSAALAVLAALERLTTVPTEVSGRIRALAAATGERV